jgi:hypothetical protein
MTAISNVPYGHAASIGITGEAFRDHHHRHRRDRHGLFRRADRPLAVPPGSVAERLLVAHATYVSSVVPRSTGERVGSRRRPCEDLARRPGEVDCHGR